jgi:hypothetical protein
MSTNPSFLRVALGTVKTSQANEGCSEKKIDRIEDRLAGIENVLASLASKLSDLDLRRDPIENSSQSRSSRKGVGRSPGMLDEASTPAPFEGETTISSQSGYVRELLAKAVGSTPSIEQNAEVKSALTALNDLVARQGQIVSSSSSSVSALINRSLADVDPEKLTKPPWDTVTAMVAKACSKSTGKLHIKYRTILITLLETPTISLAIIFPFLKMKNLMSIIADAYDNPAQCGASRRMLAYGVLHIVFTEYTTFPTAGMNREENRSYTVQCKYQIEVAMSQLDIFLPASYENIMALMLGGAWAVEMCKPSVSALMIGTAAGLCQVLGYHRYQTMKDDTEEERNDKIHIFWMIYVFDKTMSLRMGRASFIQDWDISLPYFGDSKEATDAPDGKRMLTYWVKVARVQGQTYEKLFSPAAFLHSPEERTRVAIELVNAMNQTWYERGDACVTDLSNQLPDAHLQQSGPKNSSPIETEQPSRRRNGLQRPFDGDGFVRGKLQNWSATRAY